MDAGAAHRTLAFLRQLSSELDADHFTYRRVLSAAQQLFTAANAPRQYQAYFAVLEHEHFLIVLCQAVANALIVSMERLEWPGSLEVEFCKSVAELSNTLGEVLLTWPQLAPSFPSFSQQSAAQTLNSTGVVAAVAAAASKLAEALDGYQQQRQAELLASNHAKLAYGVIKVWHGIINTQQTHRQTLSNPPIAATLQPMAGLALPVLRTGQKLLSALDGVPATINVAAAEALDVACATADALDALAELGHTFTAAPCVQQELLQSTELQQLLLVYVGSLTASLHQHQAGKSQVTVELPMKLSMQLDTPAAHRDVLKALAVDWAEHLLAVSVSHLLNHAARIGRTKAFIYHQQLSRALTALCHVLQYGSDSGRQQLQEQMLQPLLLMFVETGALMPDIAVTRYCVMGSLLLLMKQHKETLQTDIPGSNNSLDEKEITKAFSTRSTSIRPPAATAAAVVPLVLKLLAPAALHVLGLDIETGLQEYRKLYDYATENHLVIARAALGGNMSTYLAMIMREPLNLSAIIADKLVTTLAIIEAAVRSAKAEEAAASSQETSLGQFAKFTLQDRQSTRVVDQLTPLQVEMLCQVTSACEEAVCSGKLASVLSAVPARTKQSQWKAAVSGQLGSLLVTSLKFLTVSEAAGHAQIMQQDELMLQLVAELGVRFEPEQPWTCSPQILKSVLSVAVQLGQLFSSIQKGGASAGSTASSAAAAARASRARSSATKQLCAEWVVVAARALRQLGQILGADCITSKQGGADAAGSSTTSTAQGVLQQQIPVINAAAAAVAWLTAELDALEHKLPPTVSQQLAQQQDQLLQQLGVAAAVQDMVSRESLTSEQHEVMQTLPQLLVDYGSSVAAWVPQQSWCHNSSCLNLSMMRESALLKGDKRCSGCKKVMYCGKKCQLQNWPSHKRVCKHLKEVTSA